MQAAWMYLEPIFGSEDIINQMPKEGKAFHASNRVWRRIVPSVMKIKTIIEVRRKVSAVHLRRMKMAKFSIIPLYMGKFQS